MSDSWLDPSKSKSSEELNSYSYQALKELAKPDIFLSPSADSPLEYSRLEHWLRMRDKEFGKDEKAYQYTGCKFHINLKDPEKLPLAWNALNGIRMKYRKILPNSKVIMIDVLMENIKRLIASTTKDPTYADYCQYDPQDGKIYLYENSQRHAVIDSLLKKQDRYLKGANMLSYISILPGATEIEFKQFETIFAEIDDVLTELGLEPAETPGSDFPVKGRRFISLRVDRDEANKYFDFDARDKFDFVNHPVLKHFVDPEILNKKTYQNADEKKEVTTKASVIKRTFKLDVMDEIRKVLNPNNLKFWEMQCKSNLVLRRDLFDMFVRLEAVISPASETTMAEKTILIRTIINEIKQLNESKPVSSFIDKSHPKVQHKTNYYIKFLCQGIDDLLEGKLSGLEPINCLGDVIPPPETSQDLNAVKKGQASV